jgi:hypothetical protein
MSRSVEPTPISSQNNKMKLKKEPLFSVERPIGVWTFFGIIVLLSGIFLVLIMLIMYLIYFFFGDESWFLYTLIQTQ